MKAVSTVIVIILILMITVALSALSYMFFSRIYTSVTTTGKEAITQTTTSTTSLMKIEATSGNDIYIRNIGQIDLTKFSVYVNDKQVNYNAVPSVIKPGEVGKITILNYMLAIDNEVKITTGSGALAMKNNVNPCSDTSVVLCMSFDEGSGDTAKDFSNYKNSGTIYGATWTSVCKSKNCLRFDGTNDYVNIPDSLSLRPLNNLSIEFWIYEYSGGVFDSYASIINKRSLGSTYYYGYSVGHSSTQNIIQLYWGNGTNCPTCNDILSYGGFEANIWQYYVITFDSGKVRFYENATLVASKDSTIDKFGSDPSWDLKIGSATGVGDLVNGTIDELRIYSRTLSLEEISGHYNTLA